MKGFKKFNKEEITESDIIEMLTKQCKKLAITNVVAAAVLLWYASDDIRRLMGK